MEVKIAILLPYLSPHLMPFIDALYEKSKDIVIGVEKPFHYYRPNMEENKYLGLNIILLYKKENNFFKLIKNYEVGISLGIFHSKNVVRFASYFTKNNRKYFLISETEHGLNKNRIKRYLKRVVSLFINRKNFFLLAIGGQECVDYYTSIGLKPEIAYNFGYFTYKKYTEVLIEENNNTFLNLITVSQLIERKNIMFLLKAIDNLSIDVQKKISLTIIGDGNLKNELVHFSKKLYCDVNFTGNISNNELVLSLMRKNDFLVLPSLFDGWGAVVNEAIYVGLGLLLSKGVMARVELLKNNENGFLYDINNVNQLTDILKHLTSLDESYIDYKKRSIEIASFWSGNIAAKRFLKILNNKNECNWEQGPFSLVYK